MSRRAAGWPGLFAAGLFLAGLLTACSSGGPTAGSPGKAQPPNYGRGLAVYSAHCARCHDNGKSGAPTLDDVDEWDNRSFQWSDLFAEHVQRGFVKMPANPSLSDRDIREALHYMAVTIDANDE